MWKTHSINKSLILFFLLFVLNTSCPDSFKYPNDSDSYFIFLSKSHSLMYITEVLLIPTASHNFLLSNWCHTAYPMLIYETISKSFQIQHYLSFLNIYVDVNTELIYWAPTSLYPFFEISRVDLIQCLSTLAYMMATSITLAKGNISIVQFWP